MEIDIRAEDIKARRRARRRDRLQAGTATVTRVIPDKRKKKDNKYKRDWREEES